MILRTSFWNWKFISGNGNLKLPPDSQRMQRLLFVF
jgi:hypothetical protein